MRGCATSPRAREEGKCSRPAPRATAAAASPRRTPGGVGWGGGGGAGGAGEVGWARGGDRRSGRHAALASRRGGRQHGRQHGGARAGDTGAPGDGGRVATSACVGRRSPRRAGSAAKKSESRRGGGCGGGATGRGADQEGPVHHGDAVLPCHQCISGYISYGHPTAATRLCWRHGCGGPGGPGQGGLTPTYSRGRMYLCIGHTVQYSTAPSGCAHMETRESKRREGG